MRRPLISTMTLVFALLLSVLGADGTANAGDAIPQGSKTVGTDIYSGQQHPGSGAVEPTSGGAAPAVANDGGIASPGTGPKCTGVVVNPADLSKLCAPLPADPVAPAAPPPDPGYELALHLRTELTINMPALHTAPPLSGFMVTGIPGWFWVDKAGSTTQSITGSFGPLTSTIAATPRGVDWNFGDGAMLHCAGNGSEYSPTWSDPKLIPSCSHTYTQRSTKTDPNGAYSLRGSMTWDVSWTSNTGGSGTLDPVTVTATTPIRVHDLQAVLGK